MPKKARVPTNRESRESILIDLSLDAAEKALRDGTASSQVICHFLKLAETREKNNMEIEKMKKEMSLIDTKIKTANDNEDKLKMYKAAIDAMRDYTSSPDDEEYD